MDEKNLISNRAKWARIVVINITIIVVIILFFFYKKPALSPTASPTPTPSQTNILTPSPIVSGVYKKPSPVVSPNTVIYDGKKQKVTIFQIHFLNEKIPVYLIKNDKWLDIPSKDILKFYPAILTIKAGTNIHFINKGSVPIWVASDPHPVHTNLLGFNSLGPVKTGAYYGFTFLATGTFGYHNHFLPNQQGTIIVTQQ